MRRLRRCCFALARPNEPNAEVALAIGAALGGEQVTARKLGACGLTVLGVLIVTLSRHHDAARAEPARAR